MSEKVALMPTKRIFYNYAPSKVCNCAVPPDHLRWNLIPHTCNIPKHWKNKGGYFN